MLQLSLYVSVSPHEIGHSPPFWCHVNRGIYMSRTVLDTSEMLIDKHGRKQIMVTKGVGG